MSQPLIRLENICKEYRTEQKTVMALQDVNLSIYSGESLAIMGPSGSGKTTLMNILGCLDKPTKGTYWFEGEGIQQLDERQTAHFRNKKIGFVFQSFHLLPSATAKRNVELPLIYAGIPEKVRLPRVEEALCRVGLGDRMDHLPSQMSGGQCQRVAIARALVGNPSLLLADEPTGALDGNTSREIMELFGRMQQDGVTVILITHDPKVAACTERIVRIQDGVLFERSSVIKEAGGMENDWI